MPEQSYIPGKALIYSRLPNQDWFSLDEAAMHSGWSRSFIRARIKQGKLNVQKYQGGEEAGERAHFTYRIHIDDLALFIMHNASGRFSEEKPFRDVVLLVKSWPLWMIRELLKVLNKIATPAGSDRGAQQPATNHNDD